ncbi:MAG TPA: tetratricopeptide repeat protein [Thermoanaerobaculaceae bacterium]|nr:tetratricopeptide repeat protein [Thermoanaerobaculaceae bacterium]
MAGTPVVLGRGEPDPNIPREHAEEPARELERIGGDMRLAFFPGLGHSINTDELRAVQHLLDSLLELLATSSGGERVAACVGRGRTLDRGEVWYKGGHTAMARSRTIPLLATVALLALLMPVVRGQAPPEDKVKDLELKLAAAPPAEQAEILNELAWLVVRRDGPRGQELASRALALAEQRGDRRGVALAHKNLGIALMVQEKSADGLTQMQLSHGLFSKLGDRVEEAKTLGDCGMLLGQVGKLWPSIEAIQQALAIYRELDDAKGIAAATNNLGVAFYNVGDYQQALGYNLESLSIEERLGRKLGIANNLNSVGNVLSRLDEQLRAREYYQRALAVFEELGERPGATKVLNNLGNTYEKLGEDDAALDYFARSLATAEQLHSLDLEANPRNNMGIVYKKRKQYDKALEQYFRVAEIRTTLGASSEVASTYHNIAEVYLLRGQHAEAMRYLEKARAIGIETRSNEVLDSVYRLLSDVYHDLGDDRKAYQYRVLYGDTREAMLGEQRSRTMAELQEKYEAEKRSREIALLGKDNELLRKDGEIRRLALSRTRLVAGLAAAVTALLVGLVLLAFRRYLYLVAFWKKRTFIGHYRIEGEITSGGMGVVYRATSLTNPGTTVALKVIRDELAADERQRQRFINEGRIVDALDHPNIVRVLDRGEHNDRLYIAMEYLEGRSLATVLQDYAGRGQLVPLPACTAILAQLVDAVTTIHSKGIVHRDISPANVIVLEPAATPAVKLLDFGIAKLDTATTLTEAGEILGTVNYMAPERIQLRELTPASDVFSLGVLAYELLTLHKPFLADEPVEVLKQVLTREPVDPTLYRPEIPPAFATLVMAMLRKDPMQRPGDEELRHRMGRIAGETA